ncbi:MAG TPA: PocR ligand-binding domain-containing protein, partial [Anaerolineales bacterium]|nr:PocR ligand-binding domain-containing protein [Anaerolineales bacterium]
MTGFSSLKWPFIPTCLNDILDQDTLAVIESGSCERLGRPLTILDFDAEAGGFSHRIESVNEKQHYEEFCRYFRSHVQGGDVACLKWDVKQTNISLQEFQKTKEPYRLFPCHMGLLDMTYIIQIRERPVALVFSGQFCPSNTGSIKDALEELKGNPNGDIGEVDLGHLQDLVEKLAPPDDARTRLEREASHIQRIAEAEFKSRKGQEEQYFLEKLRNVANLARRVDLAQMREKLDEATCMIKEFCQCKYVLFFAGTRENDTVLVPFAQAGFLTEITAELPHFNWSKAKLPIENFILDQQRFTSGSQNIISGGIRGNHREYFTNIACLIPATMGDRYRSVLALGPFAEPVSLADEWPFLAEIARTIGLFACTGFEMFYLEQERRRWKDTAALLNHEFKTALTTIVTPIGHARSLIQKSNPRDAEFADEHLKQAEDRALLLSRITSGTLEGVSTQVEPDDLEIESYLLSALVENCANGFIDKARRKNLELVVDGTIGILPCADVDVPRMTIALANLIENAIKYSFAKTRVFIRSHLNIASGVEHATAVIEVDNIGFEIPEADKERIFEAGE